jgi:hypothetical protein
MTSYYTPFQSAHEAEAAFNAFVAGHGGLNGALAQNAYTNAFSAETHGEYEDDLHRWTVALQTAQMYVDQGVESF